MTSFVDISRPIVHPCQLGNFLQFCLILKAKRASAPPKKTREKFLLFQRGEIFNYMKDVILHCLYTWSSFDFDESYCSEGFHFYFARSQTKNHRKFSATSRAEPVFLKKTVKRQPESCFFFPTVNSSDFCWSKNPTCVFGMATWHRWVHGFVNVMGLCIELQHLQLQPETPPQKNPAALFFFGLFFAGLPERDWRHPQSDLHGSLVCFSTIFCFLVYPNLRRCFWLYFCLTSLYDGPTSGCQETGKILRYSHIHVVGHMRWSVYVCKYYMYIYIYIHDMSIYSNSCPWHEHIL